MARTGKWCVQKDQGRGVQVWNEIKGECDIEEESMGI